MSNKLYEYMQLFREIVTITTTFFIPMFCQISSHPTLHWATTNFILHCNHILYLIRMSTTNGSMRRSVVDDAGMLEFSSSIRMICVFKYRYMLRKCTQHSFDCRNFLFAHFQYAVTIYFSAKAFQWAHNSKYAVIECLLE